MSFWIHNPSILFDYKHITELWPYSFMNKDEKLNAITRFIILLSLFGYMCINRIIILILGLIIIGGIVLLYKSQKEGYISSYYPTLIDSVTIQENNPFSNVLMTDYKYNPHKEEAPQEYTPQIEKNINDAAKQSILEQNINNTDMVDMFGNDKNNFEFEQNMRQFYTTASTTIPNKQDSFLEFCYGKLPSEKPLTIY
jgi:hypothetical protein